MQQRKCLEVNCIALYPGPRLSVGQITLLRISDWRTAGPTWCQNRLQALSPTLRRARGPTRRRRYLFGGTPPTVPAAALLRETCARSDVCCKLAHYLVYLPARGVREPERVVLSSTSPNTTSAQLCCLQVGNCRLGLPCLNAFRRAVACLHLRTCRHPQSAPQYKQVQATPLPTYPGDVDGPRPI